MPERAAFGLARSLSPLADRVYPRHRWVREHLTLAFGDRMTSCEIDALARRFYRHMMILMCETAVMHRWDRNRVLSMGDGEGVEHLDQALDGGRGAILITGHIGNWEISGAMLAHRGYPVNVVAQGQVNSHLEGHLRRTREHHGMRIISDGSPRECLACLRRNEPLALLIDQRAPGSDIVVPFFGRPASCVPGPARLAAKTGAPVLMCSTRRLEDGSFMGSMRPPIPLATTGDATRDLWENSRRFQAAVEEAIRECPEQWTWHYRRWRLSGRNRRALKNQPRDEGPGEHHPD